MGRATKDEKGNVIQFPATASLVAAEAPFDTVEHASAALDHFELALELARGVLSRATSNDPELVLSGVKQVIQAALTVTGIG